MSSRVDAPGFKFIVRYPTPFPKEDLSVFLKAVKENPLDADFHFILGEALLGNGRPQEALIHLETARRLQGFNPDHLFASALCSFRLGDDEAACNGFREILCLRDDVEARNALGASLARGGKPREAEALLRDVLDKAEGHFHVWNNLGIALFELGRKEEALEAFAKAGEEGSLAPVPEFNEGLALARLGRMKEALERFAWVVEVEPSNALAKAWSGACLSAVGRRAEALEAFQGAVALDPKVLEESADLQRARHEAVVESVKAEIRRTPWGGLSGMLLEGLGTVLGGVGWAIGRIPRWATTLAALILLWAAVCLAPVFIGYYALRDEVVDIARSPTRDDSEVAARLAQALEGRRLSGPGDLAIITSPASRMIQFEYAVDVRLLPGLRKTVALRVDVDEPSFAGQP